LPPSQLTDEQLEVIKNHDVDLIAYFSGNNPVSEADQVFQ
jgi:hypothetical protein